MAEDNNKMKQELEQEQLEEVLEETDDEELDDEKLPFPNATVVRLMRKSLDPHKQIKGIVKKEMNLFLGRIVETLCKKMNGYEYSYVDYGMFKQAIETFENIQTIELEKIRIIKNLEKIKAECDILIDDVERKFHK
ncbi:MAG: hypothetical protein PHU47_00365 [Candidatus ainarchaeum sp.]|nr:hypothetical protein [Candidatus ainarchaeum sp.]